jgi:hypothetical protein
MLVVVVVVVVVVVGSRFVEDVSISGERAERKDKDSVGWEHTSESVVLVGNVP